MFARITLVQFAMGWEQSERNSQPEVMSCELSKWFLQASTVDPAYESRFVLAGGNGHETGCGTKA